jgi:D-threonate/D-erythronate kinase
MSPRVIIIADDLTGAADTGATFAAHGAETLVVWTKGELPEADVLVLSTESRHLDPEMAVRSVSTVAARLRSDTRASDRRWIYKKIDSTLRGHPGPELAALMQGLGREGVLVAPAFPTQGRTTREGRQLVEGVPLTQTVFAPEVASSDVRSMLRIGFPDEPLELLRLDLVREGGAAAAMRRTSIWVADAETNADLTLLVHAARDSKTRLLCGSAGLAHALAAMLSGEYGWQVPSVEFTEPVPSGQGVLLVAASRHPRTFAQIARTAENGARVIRPAPEWFAEGAGAATLMDDLVESLKDSAVVLTTAGLPELPAGGIQPAARLAQAVAALGAEGRPRGLVVTGGDAAIAVSHALQADGLRLQGELAPGVPWGTLVGGVMPELPVVTKAGGFGDDDTLLAAIHFLYAKGK